MRTEIFINDTYDFGVNKGLANEEGKRAPGLRLGAPNTMRLLAAVSCATLCFQAFSNAQLRSTLTDRLGADPAEASPARVGYALAKLRLKGLLRKAPRANRYTLTDQGFRVAVFLSKLHQRLLSPALDSLSPPWSPSPHRTNHPLDQAILRFNRAFDGLAAKCGFPNPN